MGFEEFFKCVEEKVKEMYQKLEECQEVFVYLEER